MKKQDNICHVCGREGILIYEGNDRFIGHEKIFICLHGKPFTGLKPEPPAPWDMIPQ